MLQQPFPREAIKQRTGGGGTRLSYVETHTVIRRLNRLIEFGMEWSWEINEERVDPSPDGKGERMTVRGTLTIPGFGSREGYGVQIINARGGEDMVKGASSDALKKAATLFGVGLDLYGPDYEEEVQERANPQGHGGDRTFGDDEEASNVRREAVREYGKKFQEFVQVIYGLGMIPDGWNKDQLEVEVINLANKHFKTVRTENNLLEKLPDAQQLTKMLTHYRKLLNQKSEHDAA